MVTIETVNQAIESAAKHGGLDQPILGTGSAPLLSPSKANEAIATLLAQADKNGQRKALEETRKWFEELISPTNGINPDHYITGQVKSRITWIDAQLAALDKADEQEGTGL